MGITIRDVAKQAGVSVATVSRYLNNSPLIAPDSVEKVRKSIQELHYEPNFMARSMVTRQSQMVAWLVDDRNSETFGNESFLRIQYGIEHALAEHGYYLMILAVGNAAQEKNLAKMIQEKRVDGVILPAQLAKKTLCRTFVEKEIPFVVVGKSAPHSWIDLDNVMAGRIATQKLLQAGSRDLCFVGNGTEKVFVAQRQAGFCEAMAAQPLAKQRVIHSKAGVEQGFALVAQAEALHDGYVVSDNETAFGLLQALHERKISVPQDVQVISFDDDVVARLCAPALTVVDIDVYQLGTQAANMLYLQLQADEQVAQQCLMPVRLIERQTTR